MQLIKRLWNKLIRRKTTTESEELQLWDKLANNCCPNCESIETLEVVATGRIALNIECSNCNALFWATPERAFGAKRLGDRTVQKQ